MREVEERERVLKGSSLKREREIGNLEIQLKVDTAMDSGLILILEITEVTNRETKNSDLVIKKLREKGVVG